MLLDRRRRGGRRRPVSWTTCPLHDASPGSSVGLKARADALRFSLEVGTASTRSTCARTCASLASSASPSSVSSSTPPTVRPRRGGRLVPARGRPRVAADGVVLAHREPRPLREPGPPPVARIRSPARCVGILPRHGQQLGALERPRSSSPPWDRVRSASTSRISRSGGLPSAIDLVVEGGPPARPARRPGLLSRAARLRGGPGTYSSSCRHRRPTLSPTVAAQGRRSADTRSPTYGPWWAD